MLTHSHTSVKCIMQSINFVYHLKNNRGNQRLLQIFTDQIIESKSAQKIAESDLVFTLLSPGFNFFCFPFSSTL